MKIFSGALLVVTALALAPLVARAQAAGAGVGTAAPAEAPRPPRPFDDPQAPAGWKRYEIQLKAGGLLSIFLPSQPQVSVNQVRAWAAGVGTNHMYMARTRTDLYLVSYVTGLAPAVTDDPQARAALFENFWQDFAGSIKGAMEGRGVKVELVSPPARAIKVGAFDAQERDFVMGEMHGTYRIVTAGGYGYAVAAASVVGPPGDEHKSFLKSFSLRAR